jgi:hypothetical protein
MAKHYASGLPFAGIVVAPAAWLVNTQANYALAPWVCAHQIQLVPVVSLLMAAISLAGGFLSWRAYASASVAPFPDSSGAGRPYRFLAGIGIVMAVLFAAVILVQGAAGLVFHGCER